jgi:hypothetical protein
MYKYEEWLTIALLVVSAILKVGSIIALYTTYGHTDGFHINHQAKIEFALQHPK